MNETLNQLSQGMIPTRTAYKELFGTPKVPRMRKAHFVKLQIRIPEEKGVNRFLAFLFLFPIPLFIVKMIIRRATKETEEIPLSKDQIMSLIGYRGVLVEVTSHEGEKIIIKTL